jgi:hypothetical protein
MVQKDDSSSCAVALQPEAAKPVGICAYLVQASAQDYAPFERSFSSIASFLTVMAC